MEEKNESAKDKDFSVFKINELMVQTYNKIANWHNDGSSGTALKILSTELIEDIAGAAFAHMDIPYKGARIQMDEEIRKKIEAEKLKMNSDAGLIPPPPKSIQSKVIIDDISI